MQQHTGQHLLSAVFLAEYGYHTESFHLGADYSSIDISTARLPEAEQIRVEDVANDLIFRNLKIDIYSATPTELQRLPVRKLPPDLAGDLRIVEIDGYDYSPCSGTHLSGTGQIGLLKLLRAENYKGMTRVHFLCGGGVPGKIIVSSTKPAPNWARYCLCPSLNCSPAVSGSSATSEIWNDR